MYCKKCGSDMGNAAFCPSCGAPADSAPAQQPVVVNVVNTNTNTNTNVNGGMNYPYKSKWAAFFLCLLFGFIGAHRFYVGKAGTGILWLFTFGLFGIGWFVDLILILVGSFRDKAGYPLN